MLGTADIGHIHRQNTERLAAIEKAQLEALKSIELESFSPMTKYSAPYGLQDLEPDPTSWINGVISRYYGIGEVYG